jgi:hypothetical protein
MTIVTDIVSKIAMIALAATAFAPLVAAVMSLPR